MTTYWIGAGERAGVAEFARAAERIGCSVEALRAVWQVEASGRPFRADGSLERRFEPHKLTRPAGNWRASRVLSTAERERQFGIAFAGDQEDAMRATSWGAPQIMGFNHAAAGFGSAQAMVEAMADSEGAQLQAFVALILAWKLAAALRAQDWRSFAARYNGDANVVVYAARIETAYQRLAGAASPMVLRSSDKGPAVRRLQAALGIPQDGSFGPETLRAVIAFQEAEWLPVDGVVGARTWEALGARRGAQPLAQPAEKDRIARVGEIVGLGTSGAGAIATLAKALPESSLNLLILAVVICTLAAAAFYTFLKQRGVA